MRRDAKFKKLCQLARPSHRLSLDFGISRPKQCSPLGFQVLTFQQKPCGTPCQPFILSVNEFQ
jgi:hypothetical protein